jgi:hypothetical protein
MTPMLSLLRTSGYTASSHSRCTSEIAAGVDPLVAMRIE